MSVEFFKANSKGKLDQIEASVTSLHFRRSVIIKDTKTKNIYVIHGKSASKKIKNISEENADRLNNEEKNSYSIIMADYASGKSLIESILVSSGTPKRSAKKSTKKIGKKQSKRKSKRKIAGQKITGPIPKVPKVGISELKAPKPKGDQDTGGPIIQEFQIAYFKDKSSIKAKPISSTLMTDVLKLISKYIEEVNNITENKPAKGKAKSVLQSVSDQIINLVY